MHYAEKWMPVPVAFGAGILVFKLALLWAPPEVPPDCYEPNAPTLLALPYSVAP